MIIIVQGPLTPHWSFVLKARQEHKLCLFCVTFLSFSLLFFKYRIPSYEFISLLFPFVINWSLLILLCGLFFLFILMHNLSISLDDKKRIEVVLRWQRNRMGRPLSPPQIYQKNIWTPSKFHRTTSECWQRTSGTQKGSPLSLKGGRTKHKR